jgi:hypothetical protein
LGYVRITHTDGETQIPQSAAGIHYFTFAMKYFYGFGNRVNPAAAVDEEAMARLSEARAKRTWMRLLRMTLLLGVGMTGMCTWLGCGAWKDYNAKKRE